MAGNEIIVMVLWVVWLLVLLFSLVTGKKVDLNGKQVKVWTNIGAFIVACILLYRGLYVHNDIIVYICGYAIIIERVIQLVFNKNLLGLI